MTHLHSMKKRTKLQVLNKKVKINPHEEAVNYLQTYLRESTHQTMSPTRNIDLRMSKPAPEVVRLQEQHTKFHQALLQHHQSVIVPTQPRLLNNLHSHKTLPANPNYAHLKTIAMQPKLLPAHHSETYTEPSRINSL